MNVRSIVALFALAAGLALICPVRPAQAKAPEADDLPTLERVFQQAKADKEKADREAAASLRDPRKDAIDNYRDGKVALDAYAPLVEIVNESKDGDIQPYRVPAAGAILQRFRTVNMDDPAVRRVQLNVALELVELMRANSTSDPVGLTIVDSVMKAWWPGKIQELQFKPTDNPRDRSRAYRAMRTFLKNGGRD